MPVNSQILSNFLFIERIKRLTREFLVIKRSALYPNPVVSNHLQLNLNSTARNYVGKIVASDGRVIMSAGGDIMQINSQVNQKLYKLKPGIYVLQIINAADEYSVKFIKQ